MGKSTALIPVLLLSVGCISTPTSDNPLLLRSDPHTENPVLISPGKPSDNAYADVFERVLNVLATYFPIEYANRWDGQIICRPTIAPGMGQPWKLGSPDPEERLLASFQTMRYRCFVRIREAENGGYKVGVTVYRELEDLPRPSGVPNVSVFRDAASVDRNFQVVDATIPTDGRWIPKGRSKALEDTLLKQIRKCQYD